MSSRTSCLSLQSWLPHQLVKHVTAVSLDPGPEAVSYCYQPMAKGTEGPAPALCMLVAPCRLLNVSSLALSNPGSPS